MNLALLQALFGYFCFHTKHLLYLKEVVVFLTKIYCSEHELIIPFHIGKGHAGMGHFSLLLKKSVWEALRGWEKVLLFLTQYELASYAAAFSVAPQLSPHKCGLRHSFARQQSREL